MIGFFLQKLIKQIAVRAMDFHAVETRGPGVFRALAKGLNEAGNFPDFQRARCDEGLLRPHQTDVTGGRDRAGRDRRFAIEKDRVGDATDMPQLQQNFSPGLMDGAGDEFPAFHLLVRPDAGRVGIAHSHGRDRGGLGNNQSGGSTLAVILGHEGVGNTLRPGTGAGQRSQKDAVGQVPSADGDGVEECGHGKVGSASPHNPQDGGNASRKGWEGGKGSRVKRFCWFVPPFA